MSLRKHKGWIAVGILLTAGLLFSWRFFRPKGAIAQITYDGKVVCIVDLSTDREFSLEEDPTVRFRVERGASLSLTPPVRTRSANRREGYPG